MSVKLNAEQMREYRGTLTEAGKDSPYRSRRENEQGASGTDESR